MISKTKEIKASTLNSPTKEIKASTLPGGEKAISIACYNSFIFALGSSGRVFEASVDSIKSSENCIAAFTAVKELDGTRIVQISGTHQSCLAVCEDGSVFGRGINFSGELGLERSIEEATQFTKISSLNSYKIVSAAAGQSHSLFLTSTGKVLACGGNSSGQLLTNDKSGEYSYSPIETTITKNATFCMAGSARSVVFVGVSPPPNTPNMTIKISDKKSSPGSNLVDDLLKKVAELETEVKTLKQENQKLRDAQDSSTTDATHSNSINILDSEEISHLRVVREISFGGSGKVLEVAKEENYALKEMNVSGAGFKEFRNFVSEYDKLCMLHHPNIIRALDV